MAPLSVAPVSNNTSFTLSSASFSSASCRSIPWSSFPIWTISAPAARKAAYTSSSELAVMITVCPGSFNSLALGGVLKWVSMITRRGWRSTPGMRTVMAGSSANTVPTPVMIAELRARRRCTSCRAASLVIHLLSPSAIAVRPSRLIASLLRTNGRRKCMRRMKPGLRALACGSSKPNSTWIPASRNCCMPLPATCGLGSCIATTTRATCAAISASLQGGVLPW